MPTPVTVGSLRELIHIDCETNAPDAEDEPLWLEIGRLRAKAEPLRASEQEREGAVRTIQVYQFTCLTRAVKAIGVAANHRLRWGSLSFNVREVRTPDDGKTFVAIIAESGVTL